MCKRGIGLLNMERSGGRKTTKIHGCSVGGHTCDRRMLGTVRWEQIPVATPKGSTREKKSTTF